MTHRICDGCLQTLDERHFTTRSYQLEDRLGGVWCSRCIHRERLGLPPRRPTFQKQHASVSWVIANAKSLPKEPFAILLTLAGYLDGEINDPTIRELSALTTLPDRRVLALLDGLVAERWLLVDWSTGEDITNTYALNTERRTETTIERGKRVAAARARHLRPRIQTKGKG